MSNQGKEPPSAPPPIICVNDRIVLEYAILDDSVGYNPDHRRLFIGDKPMWRLPCLAISQDKNSPQVMLYCCESDWSPIGIAGCNSIANAKRLAEKMYPGVSACWVAAAFTEEDRERFLEETNSDLRCSFCGKRDDERLFSETFVGKGEARICGNCVQEFYDDLQKRSQDKS